MPVAWTPQKLNEAIRRHEIYPLYLLYGDESFLIDEALAALEKEALGEGLRDFNLNTFYAGDVATDLIRDAVETLPMMAQVRVVVVKEAHELSDKDWDVLLPLVENPVPSSAFICVARKIDKRKKYIKRFTESGVVIEFKRPYDNQIPEWIGIIAKKHGITMSAEAVDLMHQLVGSDLQDVNAEMQKLAQYLGERKVASPDDLLQIISRVRIESVFDLTDAIGSNDRPRALYCLANLLDQGQNEVGVISLISRHVRILKLVTEGLKEGLSGTRLSTRAGVAPYFLRSYVDQSKHWSESKIDNTFRALIDTDRALKTSPVAGHIWLENFIIQTCD